MELQKIILYYGFAPVADPIALKLWQKTLCESLGLKGRIIVSEHGINGTLGGDMSALKKYVRQMRKEKFLVSQIDGYESFFLIPDGSNLEINDDEIVVTGKVNSANLAKAFMKFNKTRQVNRVLITKFIQGIAK